MSEIKKGDKLKFIQSSCWDLTEGKIYEAVFDQWDNLIAIEDDSGDVESYACSLFENMNGGVIKPVSKVRITMNRPKYSFFIRNHWEYHMGSAWYLFGFGYEYQGRQLICWHFWLVGFCFCLFVDYSKTNRYPASITSRFRKWRRKLK